MLSGLAEERNENHDIGEPNVVGRQDGTSILGHRRDQTAVARRFVSEGADIGISAKFFRGHQLASAKIDEDHFNDF